VALAVTCSAAVATVAFASFYVGTNGNDHVEVERSGAVAYLKGGDDTFEGARGREEDRGHQFGGRDQVYGGPERDEIASYSYGDILRGNHGRDDLKGGAGGDALYGGAGDDTLTSGAGRDLFKPGKGVDLCIGQPEDRGFPGKCERTRIAR
jgi:Ca2+-binding RTX toxin-like protein